MGFLRGAHKSALLCAHIPAAQHSCAPVISRMHYAGSRGNRALGING